MTEEDREKAIEFLDEACENQGDSWDFACRLRNAMRGLDYEEGCPALDYFFLLSCASIEKEKNDD